MAYSNVDQNQYPNPQDMVPAQDQSTNDPNAVQPSKGWLQQQAANQQASQQQAQQNAQPNPTPTGTNTPGQLVTANMPTMQQQADNNQPNGWTPPAGYLQGSTNQQNQINPANMSGNWQKGYAEGMLAKQQAQNQSDANSRANETQSWDRQMFTKQQQISQGMQQAAVKGGFGGVVDYLNTADPDRAIKLLQAKSELDKSMLQADSLSTFNDMQKKGALFQGYGLLGKMGATLLAAPQADRENLYQHMLPMVKAVVPDAPDSLNSDAVSMFRLGAGQASPDSALWQAKSDTNSAESDVGKAWDDYRTGVKQGLDPKSPYMQGLSAKWNNSNDEAQLKNSQVAELQTKQLANASQAANGKQDLVNKQFNLSKEIATQYNNDPAIKDMNSFRPYFDKFNAAWQLYSQNKNDPNAVRQMQAAMTAIAGIKKVNPNVMNYMTMTDSKAEDFMHEIENTTNPLTVLGNDGVQRMNTLMSSSFDSINQRVVKANDMYGQMADKYSTPENTQLGTPANNIRNQVNWLDTKNPMTTVQAVPTAAQLDSYGQQLLQQGYSQEQVMKARNAARDKWGH